MAEIRYDLVLGSRRVSNYVWFLTTFLGGLGFFATGLASYFGSSPVSFLKITEISFLPQGIVMLFYGVIGLLVSVFLLLSIIYNVGGGYNKYDLQAGRIEIFRLGLPGKAREIYLSYLVRDIKAIKLSIIEGLNPKHEIYLYTKDQRRIPLTRVGEPLLLSKIEAEAVDIATFLNIPLESS